jgi:dienelactone hydrolase
MKKTVAVLSSLLLFGMTAARVRAQDAPPEDELIVKARQFLAALNKNDFQAAVRDFDETMMRVSGPEKLAEFWKQVPGMFGGFKKQAAARREELGPYSVALVTCEFEKVTMDARVVFDKNKKIAGFQFIPSLPSAKYEPPKYANPDFFEEQDVVVGSGDWQLPGTLTIPKGEGPFPALVLVHGSVPNDRDETIGPNKPFKDIAWGLASHNIAVLRYEKRTRVFGPKIVVDKAMAASFTVKEESVDDAVDAVRLLQATARIDKMRIFVLGHSLGGMLIPRIAEAGRDIGIAGFIIMAGLTRPLEDAYVKQISYLVSLDGAISGEDKKLIDEAKAQSEKIKALKEADAASEMRILNAAPKYWLDLRGYDPAKAALKIGRPILVLQGSRDYQVTDEDFKNWKKALAPKENTAFKLYPKLNHLFFEGQGLPTPNEYVQIHGSVAEYVIIDIAAWIKKN